MIKNPVGCSSMEELPTQNPTIMKYLATWSSENNYLNGHYEYTNKRKAIKDIKDIAKGNRPQGGTVDWAVRVAANRQIVAKGWIDDSGSHNFSKEEIMDENYISLI